MHVVIFEGYRWTRFAPLALSRPTFMLPCGMGTLLDKQIELLHPTRLSLWVRPEMEAYCRKYVLPTLKIPATINQPLNDEPALLTTGRTLHVSKFEPPHEPSVVIEDGDLVRSAYVTGMAGLGPDDVMKRSPRWLSLLDLPHAAAQARYIDHVWDLIRWNEESLLADFIRYRNDDAVPGAGPWHLINPENIRVEKGASLSPGCVLDASKGPIVIDVGASIGANAVVEGPCYVGQYSQVQPLAHIRKGTSIGSLCKIGGEVSNSIISSCSNKGHYGYLGDSIIGSWVNFGAGTTTSNLKNTYGEVTIKIGSAEHKTDRLMLGSLIGDHTKTAIGTRLNTGSYIGYCCLLAGDAITPKFVPSFSFIAGANQSKYELKKAEDVAGRVMARRDKHFDDEEEALMRYVQSIAPTVEK
jgi:UDP-N-acetylglucosamine diphosphorylase/glucosamine-1-phosphate N-acetyltransferase